jgi:hypothetical protein
MVTLYSAQMAVNSCTGQAGQIRSLGEHNKPELLPPLGDMGQGEAESIGVKIGMDLKDDQERHADVHTGPGGF